MFWVSLWWLIAGKGGDGTCTLSGVQLCHCFFTIFGSRHSHGTHFPGTQHSLMAPERLTMPHPIQ